MGDSLSHLDDLLDDIVMDNSAIMRKLSTLFSGLLPLLLGCSVE